MFLRGRHGYIFKNENVLVQVIKVQWGQSHTQTTTFFFFQQDPCNL